MEPKTGALLAMASKPGFKLSQLDLNNPDQALFRNRAVTDVYEPGSVFKTLTASMAIDLGLVTPESTYDDIGAAYIGPSTIRNWDYSVNGITSVTQILQRSLNTGAVWMSGLIGPDAFYSYMRKFGIGEATHVGLGGEPDGLVRDEHRPGLDGGRPGDEQLRPGHRRDAAAGDHGDRVDRERRQADAAVRRAGDGHAGGAAQRSARSSCGRW